MWQRLSTLVLNAGLTLSIWFYAHILQKAKSGALAADGLYMEDCEEVVRIPFGGNHGNNVVIERSNIPNLNLDCDAFGNLSCLRCPSNPANGGDGIFFCTLGEPKITW